MSTSSISLHRNDITKKHRDGNLALELVQKKNDNFYTNSKLSIDAEITKALLIGNKEEKSMEEMSGKSLIKTHGEII